MKSLRIPLRTTRNSNPRRSHSHRARRPRLEALEDRALLTLYQFTTIADSAGPFYVFDNIYGPAINDSGKVAFMATKDVGGSGIFVGDGSATPTTVAQVDTKFKIFGDPPGINDAGAIVFPAYTNPSGMGLFRHQSGTTTLIGNNSGTLNIFGAPAINNAGSLAFTATFDAGGQGLYRTVGGSTTLLVRTGSGVNALVIGRRGINESGRVAYRADLTSGGRLSVTDGASTTHIATTGSTYSAFGEPSIDDAGGVVFKANLTAGGSGIFLARGSSISTVAASGANFSVFGDKPAISGTGRVAFYAASPVGGIGIYTGPDPVEDRVITVGSPLAGSTVQSLVLSGAGINDNGAVAFYARLADGRHVIVRADPLDGPAVSVGDATVTEADGGGTATLRFPITLTQASSVPITISYSTSNGTALAGLDYQAATGSIVIPAGQTTGTINVLTYGNNLIQPDRTLTLRLTGASTPATILSGTATGTIEDNDSIVLNTADVTVTETNASQVVHVPVTLTKALASAVTVSYSTSNGTATSGSDYAAKSGTLTIPAGVSSTTIPVTIAGDLLFEADETIKLTLSNPLGAQLGVAVSTITIVNDDPMPTVSIGDVSLAEGSSGGTTSFNFTITLSAPSGLTTYVAYSTANGTATAGSDYTAKSGTVAINPGQTSKVVTIPVVADKVAESDETFKVILSNPTRTVIGRGTATGTIRDDDKALTLRGAALPAGSVPRLTNAQLAPIVTEAIRRWRRAGVDTTGLARTPVRVADLPGKQLGRDTGKAILIDATAAGRGWYVDPTPANDSEFRTPNGKARGIAGRLVDLLSVVTHELGHRLGLSHDSGRKVMDDTLPAGSRRVPTSGDSNPARPVSVITAPIDTVPTRPIPLKWERIRAAALRLRR